MTAPVRQQRIIIEPLAVFIARAEARALLWHTGELDLHPCVDELWAAAVRDGLVAKLGPDKVQQLLADIFAPLRDDLPSGREKRDASTGVSFVAADDYDGLPSTFAKLCRQADEKQARKRPDPKLEARRRLLDDDVSFESAWHQVSRPLGVPIVTLWAAEYLHQLGDLERFKKWFDRHSAQERAAILEHLEKRKEEQGT
jgi:hypothetical protein